MRVCRRLEQGAFPPAIARFASRRAISRSVRDVSWNRALHQCVALGSFQLSALSRLPHVKLVPDMNSRRRFDFQLVREAAHPRI
jgi:hypothetical protein